MILYHAIKILINPEDRERDTVATENKDVLGRLSQSKSFQFFPTTREEWREWDKFPEPPLGAPSAGPPEVAGGSRHGSWAQYVPQVDIDPMLLQQSETMRAAHEDVES